jgi:protein-tyrosine-phosphatase
MDQSQPTKRVSACKTILLCLVTLLSTSAWSGVYVRWTSSRLPPADALAFRDLVFSWNGASSPIATEARKKGYRVYLESTLQQAEAAAIATEKDGLAGLIVDSSSSDKASIDKAVASLRSSHPKVRFLVLSPDGKQPEMRGSLVIKRGSVLEVSSPTAQPWIDTNLSQVRIERRSRPDERPMYSFAWAAAESGQQPKDATAMHFSLAVAEAGAFHADLVLQVDERLQKGLADNNAEAWKLWHQVQSYANFYSDRPEQALPEMANVALVVGDLDPGDEVMNLLARHNIPFKVLLPADLKSADLENFDVIVIFAKDRETFEQVPNLAAPGKTVVVVDAHGSYPWQKGEAVRVNEQTMGYAVEKGSVLELSEPVSDPETFAQDIRRLLGKQNALISIWNGLTAVAVPYKAPRGVLLELVNYAEEPVRIQVQVKGSFDSIRYETPDQPCCKSLVPVKHNGFTEFVIPDLMIAARVHLEGSKEHSSSPTRTVTGQQR